MRIHTLNNLHQYVSDITENYDPYTWNSLNIDKDTYDQEFTNHLIELIKTEYKFTWGDDMPNISNEEWHEIEKTIDSEFGE